MLEFCLVYFVVRIGQGWSESSVWSVRVSAFLAQASLVRLGEISKDANPVATRASRSSDVDWVWATRTLAQVKDVRLGEMVLRLRMLSVTSRSSEEFMGFERTRVSLRRDGLA